MGLVGLVFVFVWLWVFWGVGCLGGGGFLVGGSFFSFVCFCCMTFFFC